MGTQAEDGADVRGATHVERCCEVPNVTNGIRIRP